MKILAIDAATRCGFAWGDSNGKPVSLSHRLKGPEDEPERAFKRLGIILRDMFSADAPELVVVEAPMSMGAMIRKDEDSERGFKFASNPSTIYLLNGLIGVVFGICGPYGIRARTANVQAVRKDFLGKARPQDPKRSVLARCVQLGWLDKDCKDDNRADALSLWSHSCGKYASRLGALADASRGVL